MSTKVCTICKIEKSLSEFNKSRKAYGPYCKPCNREYGKKNYQDNKQRYFEQAKKRDKDLDNLINQYKARPCMDCGKTYPHYVMDFCHRERTNKRNPSRYTKGDF